MFEFINMKSFYFSYFLSNSLIFIQIYRGTNFLFFIIKKYFFFNIFIWQNLNYNFKNKQEKFIYKYFKFLLLSL